MRAGAQIEIAANKSKVCECEASKDGNRYDCIEREYRFTPVRMLCLFPRFQVFVCTPVVLHGHDYVRDYSEKA